MDYYLDNDENERANSEAGKYMDQNSGLNIDPNLNYGFNANFDTGPDNSPDEDIDTVPNPGADTADTQESDPVDEKNKTRMELYDWLQCIVSAIICGIFIFVFIGRTIGVDGKSMMYTLHNNDRVIMSNLFYTPKKGDIVVFQAASDAFGGTPLVKRVIAVAGQTIDIDFQNGDVFVDGVVQDEPYIAERTNIRINFTGPVTVPEGYIFVMGDNRNHSSDSRDLRVGLVDTRYVLGRVLMVIIPGSDDNTPRDWNRIGLIH
jgi:signal peptidase I